MIPCSIKGSALDGGGTFECVLKGSAKEDGFTVSSADGRFDEDADFDQDEDEWWYSKRDDDIGAPKQTAAAASAPPAPVDAVPVGAHVALDGKAGNVVLTAVQAIYDRYDAMTAAKLQALLKHNKQRSTGEKGNNKASLVGRCTDREMFGALPTCDGDCKGEAFNAIQYADAFSFSLESASNWRHNGTVGKVSCQGNYAPPQFAGGQPDYKPYQPVYKPCSKCALSVQRLPWVAEVIPATSAEMPVRIRPTAGM